MDFPAWLTLHSRAATREAWGHVALASDLSVGLLFEEQDSQLPLLLLPCKEEEKWTMKKRKGRNQTVFI